MSDVASLTFAPDPAHNLIGTSVLASQGMEASGRLLRRSLIGSMIVVALIGVTVDQASKAWAFASPSDLAGPRELAPGLVAAVLARNDGAVAHLAGGRPMTATICALNGFIMIGVVAWWFYGCVEPWRRRDAAFVGLLFAGMLGNSIDRLALGYVRDFLVATLWPVLIFNLADVFIVLGVLLMLASWAVSRLERSTRCQNSDQEVHGEASAVCSL